MLERATCGTQRQARCRRRAPRRRGEGFRGEAPWPQFTNLIDAALDLPMQEKNASPEKDGTECTNKPERWVRVDGRRDQPADQLRVARCRVGRVIRPRMSDRFERQLFLRAGARSRRGWPSTPRR